MIENIYTAQPPANARLIGTVTTSVLNTSNVEEGLKQLANKASGKSPFETHPKLAIYALQISLGYGNSTYLAGTLAATVD